MATLIIFQWGASLLLFSCFLILSLHQSLVVVASMKYQFDNVQDEAQCDLLRFKKITEFRRLSVVPLKWSSANACCKAKGMVLHSPESGAEKVYLFKTLKDKLAQYWSSGNNFRNPPTYTWEWGTSLGLIQKKKEGFKLEVHAWNVGELEKTGDCISISMWPEKKGVKLIKNDCNEAKQFICQLRQQIGGKDLSSADMQLCNKASLFKNVPGVAGYKFGMVPMRWKVANFCCQQKDWALAGNLLPDNDALMKGITDLYKKIDHLPFWTSLNDFCVDREFRWACGIGETNTSKWRDENPDNYGLFEDCGQHYWTAADKEKIFYANDLNCDLKMLFICQVDPPCARDKQYYCPNKAPRIMNPEDSIDDDELKCASTIFRLIMDTPRGSYYMSDTELTWVGAMNCLIEKKLIPASYQEEEDIDFFNAYIRKEPIEVWNAATSWRRSRGDVLIWPDGSQVSESRIFPFYTHDQIDPICGKTTLYGDNVGIMTENCLRTLKFFYKIPIAGVPNILPINVCSKHAAMSTFRTLCNNTLTTVNPKKKPFQSNNLSLLVVDDEETLTKIRFQNVILKNIAVDFSIDDSFRFHVHNPDRGFKLLSLSTAIYSKLCPKVPADLLVNAFKYFYYLHWITSQGRTEHLSLNKYHWINTILHKCFVNSTASRYRTDPCDELIMAKNKCPQYLCVEKQHQFNIQKRDPLLEMIWKVFELVHSACFSYFEESYLMFHKYGKAISDLWSEDVRLRWFNQLETNEFWERILGPLYEVHLLNMDKCNFAVISKHLNARMLPETMPNVVRMVGGREFGSINSFFRLGNLSSTPNSVKRRPL